jgi:hypothetical protein
MTSLQLRIFAVSVLAGLLAGGMMAALNLVLVRPYFDLIAESVIDQQMADGAYDEEEFDSRLESAYLNQTWGALGIGLASGALIGGVRVSTGTRAGRHATLVDALIIAGVAWFVLYVVPVIKYPLSPAAMFDAEAEGTFYPLYYGYLAVSGLAALAIAAAFRRISVKNKIFGMAALYLVVVAVAFFMFPGYELDSTFDQQLLNAWRASVSAATTALWFASGLISGILWKGAEREKKANL